MKTCLNFRQCIILRKEPVVGAIYKDISIWNNHCYISVAELIILYLYPKCNLFLQKYLSIKYTCELLIKKI